MITLERCRKWMIITWLIPSVFLIVFVAFQTLGGHFGNRIGDAWNWVCTTALPMTGIVLAVTIPTATKRKENIPCFYAFLAIGVSLVYWLLIWVPLLLGPFTFHYWNAVDYMVLSNFWLAPMQCVVGACLGFAFSLAERKHIPTE